MVNLKLMENVVQIARALFKRQQLSAEKIA